MKTRSPSYEAGIGMIEVFMTLVILLFGLLALAGLMLNTQRAETEAYQRSQALILVQDMVARINTNRRVASFYAITDGATGSPFLGAGSTVTPACTTGTLEQNNLASSDMAEWGALLSGMSETLNNVNVGGLIGGRGCVSLDATTGVYHVSVAWQGLGESSAPPTGLNCGKGQYGPDAMRRASSVTVRVADLKGA